MRIPRRPSYIVSTEKYSLNFKSPFCVETKPYAGGEIIVFENVIRERVFKEEIERVKRLLKIKFAMKDNKYLEYVKRYNKYLENINSSSYLELTEIANHFINAHKRIKVK